MKNLSGISPEIFIGLQKVYEKVTKEFLKSIPFDQIQDAVCEKYNLEPWELQTKSRKKEIVGARQVVMTFCMVIRKEGQAVAGLHYKKDHATALSSKRVFKNHYQTEKEFRKLIWDILHEIGVNPAWFDEEIRK